MTHGPFLSRRWPAGMVVVFFVAATWLSCEKTVDKPADVIAAEGGLPDKVDYNLHVKPILSDRCFACHGPDANKQKAGLRLDIAQNAYEALAKSGHRAIVPGNLAKSELFHRITSTDPQVMMPTPASNLSLTGVEKAILLRWIEQGAEYKEHWSLLAPVKPPLPVVHNGSWVKNEIDRFVGSKLAEKGLVPTGEADEATLLRRVSLDLTGLPPTVGEVDAYLADPSPLAYEQVVDRLLASPHYGEHQAVAWLDLARYADTHGYQLDVMRTAWPYRDWVIRAYNQNLPFDQFVTWQLAGDMLPSRPGTLANRDRLIATAFNRVHPQNQEGGIVEDEYRAEYAADRTATFGKAFLGLTVECARCHDHKYDPISQKDYYQLFAYFNQVNEAGQVPYHGESSPTLILTDAQADQQLRLIQAKISALPMTAASPEKASQGLLARYSFDDTTHRRFMNAIDPNRPATVTGDESKPPMLVPGRFGCGRAVNGDGNIDLGKGIGFFDRYDPFSVSMWIKLLKTSPRQVGPIQVGPVFSRSNGQDNGNRGYECLMLPNGTLSFQLNHNHPDNAIDLRTVQQLPINQWVHLGLTYDGSGRASGTHVFVNGQLAPTHIYADNLKKSMIYGPQHTNGFGIMQSFQIGSKFRDSMHDFWVDELNLFDRAITPAEVATLHRHPTLDNRHPALPDTARLHQLARLKALRKQETEVYDAQPEVMVMNQRRYPRPTHLLKRGVYDAPGEEVHPKTPHALPTLPHAPKNRLGLAQWLLSANNPLFARVVVNRLWQQVFGRGLVASSDDFGNQGNLPTHPELLDYLAIAFREGNATTRPWNYKALLRQLVLSATYRQSSWRVDGGGAQRAADPDNQYLSRGPSYRLSAEQIRDNALAASGLLNRRVGGPSVYPYQPAGVWESLSGQAYHQSHGDSLYRRTLYTIWKRTAPPPALLTFDTPERHACIVRRQKTSTPLQALVTLNDPQFVEAARVLAQTAPTAFVNYFIKAVLSRPARPAEIVLLNKLYAEELAAFTRNPKQAKQLVAVGEYPIDKNLSVSKLAAMTVVASAVMNMDEAIMSR